MPIFGFILFVLLFIFVFGFSIIAGIVKAIFGIGRNKPANGRDKGSQSNNREYPQSDDTDKRKKIFDKNEGEYVDYEEIKDDGR